MKTYMAKGETVERNWYVVDADGMVLSVKKLHWKWRRECEISAVAI